MLKWNLVRLVIAASLVLTLAGSRSMLAGPPVVLTDPLTPEEQLKKFKLQKWSVKLRSSIVK